MAELDRRFGALTAQTAPVWGVMSAHQMLYHLRDSMRWAASGAALKLRLSPLANPVGRYLIFASGIPWPRNVPTVPELDLRGRPQPDVELFAGDLESLRQQMAEFAVLAADRLSPEHPFFGPMTREYWMRWAYLHADHHLRQFGRV